MISSLWIKIAQISSAALAVVFVLFKARESGKESVRKDNLDKTLKGIKIRDEVENDIDSADTTKRERLRNKWTRK